MATIAVGFEWPVTFTGYEVKPVDPIPKAGARSTLLTGRIGASIVPKGKRKQFKKPLEIRPLLYADFATLDGSPASCIKFAEKWGLLGDPLKAEEVSWWQDRINEMRGAIEAWHSGTMRVGSLDKIANLSASLVESESGLVLQIVPNSLWDAMCLQYAQHVASNKNVRTCEGCGTWFEAGLGTHRRVDARYHSDACRIQHHNRRAAIQKRGEDK